MRKVQISYIIKYIEVNPKILGMPRCSKCGDQAIISLNHPKIRLCREHFNQYFINKVKKTIKQYKMIKGNEKIAVAISGGKDSSALLHILSKSFRRGIKLKAVHINLKIKGYSERCLKISKRLSEELETDLDVIDAEEEAGFTLETAIKKLKYRRAPCSICGLIKRRILNDYALKSKLDKIALGHNLDDEVAFLINNYYSGNIDLLMRGGASLPSRYGVLVGRIKPLYETSEWEIAIYCKINSIEYVDIECPYAKTAPTLKIKRLINQIEELRPGFKLGLIRNFNTKIKPVLLSFYSKTMENVKFCRNCNYPTTSTHCAFCRLKSRVLGLQSSDS